MIFIAKVLGIVFALTSFCFLMFLIDLASKRYKKFDNVEWFFFILIFVNVLAACALTLTYAV